MSKIVRNQYIQDFCNQIQQEQFFFGIISTNNLKCSDINQIRRKCDDIQIQVIKIKNKILSQILLKLDIKIPDTVLKNQILFIKTTNSFRLAELNNFLSQKHYANIARLEICADKTQYILQEQIKCSDQQTAIARLVSTMKFPIIKITKLFSVLSNKS